MRMGEEVIFVFEKKLCRSLALALSYPTFVLLFTKRLIIFARKETCIINNISYFTFLNTFAIQK